MLAYSAFLGIQERSFGVVLPEIDAMSELIVLVFALAQMPRRTREDSFSNGSVAPVETQYQGIGTRIHARLPVRFFQYAGFCANTRFDQKIARGFFRFADLFLEVLEAFNLLRKFFSRHVNLPSIHIFAALYTALLYIRA